MRRYASPSSQASWSMSTSGSGRERVSMRSLLTVSLAALLSAIVPAFAVAGGGPAATIVGTVTLTAADGSTFPGQGARVALTCPREPYHLTEVSDEHGIFRFR